MKRGRSKHELALPRSRERQGSRRVGNHICCTAAGKGTRVHRDSGRTSRNPSSLGDRQGKVRQEKREEQAGAGSPQITRETGKQEGRQLQMMMHYSWKRNSSPPWQWIEKQRSLLPGRQTGRGVRHEKREEQARAGSPQITRETGKQEGRQSHLLHCSWKRNSSPP